MEEQLVLGASQQQRGGRGDTPDSGKAPHEYASRGVGSLKQSRQAGRQASTPYAHHGWDRSK